MLQKILVVLVGLVMSLVGALAPSGMFAAQDPNLSLSSASTTEQVVSTVRVADQSAFARLSVLWIEVDGRRVTEDAWGTGEIKELRFQVGARDVDAIALAVGQKLIPLKPTDVLTIRTFRGDFAFRHAGDVDATLQLQGIVKTTLVNEGTKGGAIKTERPLTPDEATRATRIAYVVLGTGESVETVALQPGGDRIVTEEGGATQAPGNLLVKWVKVDGQQVREYTWHNGIVDRIEFEPANAGGDVTLSFDDEKQTLEPREHVLVKGFVGEYLVYQVPGGLLRLRLDGYAADLTTGDAAGGALPTVPGAPHAAFDFTPAAPRTSDLVSFTDRSSDEGALTFWRWDFGDGFVSTKQDAQHRYAKPGLYEVTLEVADDDLQLTRVTRLVQVQNAAPVAEFSYAPRVVTSQGLVQFTDASLDLDGGVVRWAWDFGDGATSDERSPSHRFLKSGTRSVTLTVTDDAGATHTVTRTILVRNAPPLASFDYAPNAIKAGVPVHFRSTSVDHDGSIVSYSWNFGDVAAITGTQASTADAFHTFRFAGTYPVTLTVVDDAGVTDSVMLNIGVENQAPTASFDVHGEAPYTTSTTLTFRNTARDPDGVILLSQWDFGDGTNTTIVTRDGEVYAERITRRNINATLSHEQPPFPQLLGVEHRYAKPGTYEVTLCVTDNFLMESCATQSVGISNSAPNAAFRVEPTPGYRHVPTYFTDLSRDPDGDRIVSWAWTFGDGASSANPLSVAHQYQALGNFTATLRVTDSDDNSATAEQTVRIINHPPYPRLNTSQRNVSVGEKVWLNASIIDPDNSPGTPTFTWIFTDGNVTTGASIEYRFTTAGRVGVQLIVTDGEGASSNPTFANWFVSVSPPFVDWTADTFRPQMGGFVNFTDLSWSLNGPIVERTWDFNDGTPQAHDPTVMHQFHARGSFDVSLTVRDAQEMENSSVKRLRVNAAPLPAFFITQTQRPDVGIPVTFRDTSIDPDAQAGDTTDRITLRTWDFDDGTAPLTTTDDEITYIFQRAGPHNVKLTVQDAYQGVASVTKPIEVSDRSPLAFWQATPRMPMALQTVGFSSAGSYDPDGGSIVSWSWTLGDGATSSIASPTHVYATSGMKPITLIVGDGHLNSAPARGELRVTSAHPLDIVVRAELPDGTWADLADSRLEVRFTLARTLHGLLVETEAANFTYTTEGGKWLVAAGEWADSDRLVVELHDTRFLSRPLTKQFRLSHADTSIDAKFVLPIPIDSTIKAAPGDEAGVVSSAQYAPDGGAMHYTLDSTFNGTGTSHYRNGQPANGATVRVEMRYIPGYVPTVTRPLRDDVPISDTNILGWCLLDTVTSDAQGKWEWEAEPDSPCTFANSAARPPGRYEVRAVATQEDATIGAIPRATIYVDPTGLLAPAYLP